MTVEPDDSSTRRPEIVAHRAGNDPSTASLALGRVDMIELDTHVYRGRVEVRHAKVLRPTRRLWEKWFLLPAGTTGVPIEDVLAVLDPQTPLLVDLKCFTRSAVELISAAVPSSHPVLASTRSWWILDRVAGRPGWSVMRSCGSRWQVWLAERRVVRSPSAVAVRADRLTSARLRELVDAVGTVYVWGVETVEQGTELSRAGVSGLIVDDLSLPWSTIRAHVY